MAKFVESFDPYNGVVVNTGLLARWFNSNAAQSARQAMVSGRFAGQAYSAGAGSGSTIHQTNCLLSDVTGSTFTVTDFAWHVALKPKSVSANGAECGICLSNSSNVMQLGIRWIDNKWQIVRWGAVSGGSPAAVLWESSPVYGSLDWYSFSLKGTLNSTTGTVAMQIDGTEVCNLTGINTGTGPCDRVSFAQGNTDSAAGVVADDLVISDSNSAYLPPLRIDQYLPNSDGSTLDFIPSTGTSHFAMVDEAILSTTDYLSGPIVGNIDLLGLPDMTYTPASIIGVNLVGFAAKTDASGRSVNLGIESGGTTSNGPNMPLSTGVGYFSRLLETDPDTSLEWTRSGVDAAQLQPRVAV